jgi:hypothetical protein
MASANEYRERAGECERQAKRAHNATAKEQSLDLAKAWHLLAEQAERTERRKGTSPQVQISP